MWAMFQSHSSCCLPCGSTHPSRLVFLSSRPPSTTVPPAGRTNLALHRSSLAMPHLDPALPPENTHPVNTHLRVLPTRRAGRFDREISLGIPTEAARVKILQVISRRLRLDGNFDFHYVAKRTPGGVPQTFCCKQEWSGRSVYRRVTCPVVCAAHSLDLLVPPACPCNSAQALWALT